ncbi:hypothetical protein H8R23_05050 [Flavobacterium sp. F-380]|uniref:Major capsid protein n=1 Tax=Flavobacterium kayseriense TaxID=2764714 RepID=A0ABR7J5D9_9FLAO|nr:hypothetical protein [Flavobacterium kayseriense]MBC5840765.1 hypothetical protein [Flavobacterium kayseriense]MBC5846565.1 hypothetical protein [Flavobacterium kayseriense]
MSVNIDQVLEETKKFAAQNPTILNAAVMSNEIVLNRMAKLIPKIRGEFASVNSVMGHVVQAFSTTWAETADVQFRGKQLKNYHQKVNFAFTPAEILGSWIQQKYDEGVELKDKTISKHVMTMLTAKIISDVNILSVKGVYNVATPTAWLASMDGLNKIHTDLLANTVNPCFKIETDAITDLNILDVVLDFEKGIPEQYRDAIKEIKMSTTNAQNHKLLYEDTFGKNTDYKGDKGNRTRLGERTIVAVPNMSNDKIVATIDGNFVRMIDVVENPATITDVQKLDYKIKVFGEFTLGYDYAVNELVLMNTSAVLAIKGLGNAALNALYYPEETL